MGDDSYVSDILNSSIMLNDSAGRVLPDIESCSLIMPGIYRRESDQLRISQGSSARECK